jgi:hypothetical protein
MIYQNSSSSTNIAVYGAKTPKIAPAVPNGSFMRKSNFEVCIQTWVYNVQPRKMYNIKFIKIFIPFIEHI